jgi:hypothetical protein
VGVYGCVGGWVDATPGCRRRRVFVVASVNARNATPCVCRKGAKYIVQEASRGINEAQRGGCGVWGCWHA